MAMQVTEINDTTKRNLAVAEDTRAVVGENAQDTKEILSSTRQYLCSSFRRSMTPCADLYFSFESQA
jgi:hypothetical protein